MASAPTTIASASINVPSTSSTQPPPVTSSTINDCCTQYNPCCTTPQIAGRVLRFEGRCEELKSFVYDSVDLRQAEQYTKTTNEIAEFIGRTYKYGLDTQLSIQNMTIFTCSAPEDPPDDATKTELRIWEKTVDDYVVRKTILQENLKTAYSLIWGQCSNIMQQKVEASPGYKLVSQTGNAIELLKIIKTIAFNYQTQKYLPQGLHDALKRFYNSHQLRNQTIQAYYEYFQNQVNVVLHIGGSIGIDPAMLARVANELGKDVKDLSETDRQRAHDKFLAVAFLNGTDQSKFGQLLDQLQNDHLQGQDVYPKTLVGAYHLLMHWKQESSSNNNMPTYDSMAFITSGNTPSTQQQCSNQGNNNLPVTCYRCGRTGHYANQCPEENAKIPM